MLNKRTPPESRTMNVMLSLEQVHELARATLVASGANEANAEPVAQSVEDAEAEGIRNVGLSYLPLYCEHLRCGKVDGRAVPAVRQRAPAALHADAANGFCHPAFVAAEQAFVTLAQQTGTASLAITRSYSAGVVGWFVDRLARRGLVSLAFANSPPLVAAWGGKRRFFGTNPLAFGAPRASRPPLVIDMSTSATARVNIVQAAASGTPIPLGWALDRDGKPTKDAQRAMEGTVAPLGGHKGTGLAIMVNILAAGLSGARWSHEASPFGDNSGGPPGVGQLFIALSSDRFGVAALGGRIEGMLDAMCADEGVRVP
ncbi:MAG: Ldh family oxidoreductase, partial [Alphaproteobacteria bacterium]|nr:Ldh family oxidoreductase [Alphaproteobacteria bacterium]